MTGATLRSLLRDLQADLSRLPAPRRASMRGNPPKKSKGP
jgi:hypothetical protein